MVLDLGHGALESGLALSAGPLVVVLREEVWMAFFAIIDCRSRQIVMSFSVKF